ncbi:MAG: universal stress protein [Acetobacterales bacterium]
MYSNILIPVAFEHEPAPDSVLEVARALSAKGARIVLLNVVEEIPTYVEAYLTKEVMDRSVKDAKARLAEIAGDAGSGVEAKVVKGHAGRAILEFAEQRKCDCIVIASHKPGLQDYFIGSTAGHVVRYAPCAVHVLR